MACNIMVANGVTSLWVVLQGKKVCMSSLPEPLGEPFFTPLPPILHVQLDNCTKSNKCQYVFYFLSLLMAKCIFQEVFVSFLMVRHTHDDINASFGRWSMKLHEEDVPTIHGFGQCVGDLAHDWKNTKF